MHVSLNYLTGALAMWAVRLSPYPVPDNIEVALAKFRIAWTVPEKEGWPGCYEFEGHGGLRDAIAATIDKVPEIRAWNERKNGNQAPYNFVSRYSGPTDPDNDFIDLGALAGNTAMTCLREYEHDKAFNDDFDRRWNSTGAKVGRWWAGVRHRFA